MHRLPTPFSESTWLCSQPYMLPAGRLQIDSLPPALASQQCTLPTCWLSVAVGLKEETEFRTHIDHNVEPRAPGNAKHTKHLYQVSQSHRLCHIGFVGKKDIYSSNHNSPRYAMPESFTASFPYHSVMKLITANPPNPSGIRRITARPRSHHSCEQRSPYTWKLRRTWGSIV